MEQSIPKDFMTTCSDKTHSLELHKMGEKNVYNRY